MYEKIIVPVDVTDLGKATVMLETARKLGGNDAKIILTHIVEDIPSYIAAQIPGGYAETAKQEAYDALTGIAETAGFEVDIEIRLGHAAQGILTVADNKRADTIVLASHRPGIENYFLGSTAARVVKHAKCTVVVIR